MREIVVISGKGGTGKTTVCASFAHLAENKVICDLDVDAPDLHILLQPEVKERTPFISGHSARIRQDDCIRCAVSKLFVPMTEASSSMTIVKAAASA